MDKDLLLSKISSYDRGLKRDPKSHMLHYAKAEIFVDLAKETGEKVYYDQALISYDKAIEFSSQNRMYLADRSKLHVTLERYDLAVKDIIEAQKAPSIGNKILDRYCNTTARNILMLSEIKTEVENLISSNEVSPEVGKILLDLTGEILHLRLDVSGLNSDVKKNESKIDILQARLTHLEAKFSQELAIKERIIDQLKKVLGKSHQHDKAIEDLNEQLMKICTKEEFQDLAIKFDASCTKQILFGGKIEMIEGMLEGQKDSIATINQTLAQSNCFNKQQVKEGFAALKAAAPDGILYDYANHFYWSLSNYLLAYRAIASGAVSGIRDEKKLEKIWQKVGSAVIKVTEAIPVAGEFLALVEHGIMSINNAYKDMKFDRKVTKINQLITGFILEEDLNLAIASAAIKIARMKKQEIIEQYRASCREHKDEQKTSTSQKAKDDIGKKVEDFNDKIELFLAKMTNIKISKDMTGEKMAVKDVILFLNYIATNEVILINSEGDVPSLDETITLAFEVGISSIGNTNQAIHAAVTSNNGSSDNGKCIVSMLNEVIYDNPLLNSPELFKEAANHYGINKALNLSELLDENLICEAIQSQNPDLILAGMLSLD